MALPKVPKNAVLGAKKLTQSKAQKTAYNNYSKAGNSEYDKSKNLINQVGKMGNFSTDKSAYYQQAYNSLKQAYTNRGRQNMQNTIADAAASNTGGYGNSYGATAGNAAFQSALNSLTAQIPELYSAASSAFYNQKSDLLNQAGAWQTQGTAARDKAYNLLSYLTEKDYNDWQNDNNNRDVARQIAQWQYETALNKALNK